MKIAGSRPRTERVIENLKREGLLSEAEEAAMWARVSLIDLIEPARPITPRNTRARAARNDLAAMWHLAGYSWNVLSQILEIDRKQINVAYHYDRKNRPSRAKTKGGV